MQRIYNILNYFKEGASFIGVTAAIFGLSFAAINYPAYAAIMHSYINPEAQLQQEKDLKNVLHQKQTKQILLDTSVKKKDARKTFPDINLQVAPPDNRLIIPSIGKNIPIVITDQKVDPNILPGEFEGIVQEALKDGVLHYPGTADPGQFGNVFITGHSSYYPWDDGRYKEVFALLEHLEIGDVYYIYHNQKKYTYKIREKKIVSPQEVSVLAQPTDKKISTLMTCNPVGTSLNRLILVAEDITSN
jgi:LPXTG-site transpeptidase (sortase) family protein